MIMNDEHQISILSCPEESITAFEKLTKWAEELHLIYAWIHTSEGTAAHWKLLPLEKIRRALIGIHFAQTEPLALRKLSELPDNVLKVIKDTSGVFHPKLILGIKGNSMHAIMGSSNLTTGGFSSNTEINVLIKGPKKSDIMKKLLDFMNEQWLNQSAFKPDTNWLNTYEKAYEDRPRPPIVPSNEAAPVTVIRTENDLNLTWDNYYKLILKQEGRTIANGYIIHIFDNDDVDSSYMEEIGNCKRAFMRSDSFAEMRRERRQLVSGFGRQTTGLFGSMGGAGRFMNIVNEEPAIIAKYLDTIPLAGELSKDTIKDYLDNMTKIDRIGLGTATRLLAMKRPDCFLPINDGNRQNIRRIFGRAPTTVSGYIKLHNRLWESDWFKSDEPTEKNQIQIWRARVALLDSLLYEMPE